MGNVIAAPAPGDEGRDDKHNVPSGRPETGTATSPLDPPDPDYKLRQLTERPEPHPDLRALLGYPGRTRYLSDAAKGAVLRDTRHLLHEIALTAGPAQQSVRALIDLYDVETQRPWAKGIQTAFNALSPDEQAQPLSRFIESPKPNRAPAPYYPSAAADGWPPMQPNIWLSPLNHWSSPPKMNSQVSNASSGSKESNSPGTSGRQREHYVRTDEGSEWVSALVTWVLPVAASLRTIGISHDNVTSRWESAACPTDAAEVKPRPLVHEALSTLESQLEGLKEWLVKADDKRPGPLLQAVERPLGTLTVPSDIDPWQQPIAEMEYEMDRYRSLVYLWERAADKLDRQLQGRPTDIEREGYDYDPLKQMSEVARERSPFQLWSDNSMKAFIEYLNRELDDEFMNDDLDDGQGEGTLSDGSGSSEAAPESVETPIQPIEELSEEDYTALVRYVLSQSFIFQTEPNNNRAISEAARSMADDFEKPITFAPDYKTLFRTFSHGEGLEPMLERALRRAGVREVPSFEEPLTTPEDGLRRRVTTWLDYIEYISFLTERPPLDHSAFANARRAEFSQGGAEAMVLESWASGVKTLNHKANHQIDHYGQKVFKKAAINVLVKKPQAIFNILDALGNEAKPR